MSEKAVTDDLRAIWTQKPPTVAEAVKSLRIALNDTQQQFAQRLGLAISTVVRYESIRAPRGAALAKLVYLASDNGLVHISEMFRYAINCEAGLEVQSHEDWIREMGKKIEPHSEWFGEASGRIRGWGYELDDLDSLLTSDLKPKEKVALAVKTVSKLRSEIKMWQDASRARQDELDALLNALVLEVESDDNDVTVNDEPEHPEERIETK